MAMNVLYSALVLLSTMSYNMAYPFGQFGLAALAGPSPSLLPSLLALACACRAGGGSREGPKAVPALLSDC